MGLGGSLNHVAGFLDFFDPPPHVDHFTKKGLCTWIFRDPPFPPWSSTWFKDPS